MKLYQVIARKSLLSLIFLCLFNNCFADRDHPRFITNNSTQPWILHFSFTAGSSEGGFLFSDNKVIGLVEGSECVQDKDCTVAPGETKTIIYRAPTASFLAHYYNGSVKIIDSHNQSFVYEIQGQYFHLGPWIYASSNTAVAFNTPKGGDIQINKDFWDGK